MPIYVYSCSACGEASEFLQPMGAVAPATCDLCGATSTLRKQVTSAAFQLRGSGWYETDFKTAAKSDVERSDETDSAAKDTVKDMAKDTTQDTAKQQKAADTSGGDSGTTSPLKGEDKKAPASEAKVGSTPSPTAGTES